MKIHLFTKAHTECSCQRAKYDGAFSFWTECTLDAGGNFQGIELDAMFGNLPFYIIYLYDLFMFYTRFEQCAAMHKFRFVFGIDVI